jgi:hypothetical protein
MDVDLDNLSVLAPAKRLAEQALTELLSPDPTVRNAALEALRPRDEDYGQVFSPEVADGVKQATETAWQRLSPPRVGPRTQLQLGCTLAEHINQSGAFPGGYKRLEGQVQPGRVWVLFRFAEPGSRTGLTFDGLVYMGAERFAWFPKAWRGVPTA